MDAPITRPLLQTIAGENALSPQAIDAALELSGLRPTPPQSLAFALRALNFAGVLSIAAGVIFFVASNWQHFPPLTRFGIIEAPLLAALLFALISGPQHFSGQLALFFAILNTGALLALLGQTYQSGADTYTLFAYWALLNLPLAIAARYTPAWALWFLIANTAILLYPNDRLPCALTFYANLAAFTMTESFYRYPRLLPNLGRGESWLRRALLAASVASGTISILVWIATNSTSAFPSSTLDILLFCAACAAIAIYTWNHKVDIFPFALLSLSFIAISTAYLARIIGAYDPFFFLLYAFYILATATVSVKALNWISQQWQSYVPVEPLTP
jgi:uncharacterized membrane protein